jgi:hypothetical protein
VRDAVELRADWLFRGYFEVSDPAGGPSATQHIRDGLAVRLGRPPAMVKIANYPVGPAWKHTFWWREGDSDYAEAQFFARIAEEYPILSVGVSVEKGFEDEDAAPSAKLETYQMDRRTWDWPRLKSRAEDLITMDVPSCAALVSRPVTFRCYTHRYERGQRTTRERRVFVFDGTWFERHVGGVERSTIIDHVRDLDTRKACWVDAYLGCDLFPNEVEGMKPEVLVDILWSFAAVRRRLRPKTL